MFGIGAIDAFYGDRERAVFESCYPAFFFQIPEMKLQMLTRTAGQAFKVVIADAGFIDVLSAFDIKNRQHLVLNVDIPFDAFTVIGLFDQFPAEVRMVFMLNIVLRAFDRIFERIMGLHDFAEAQFIAGDLIVGGQLRATAG